MYQRGLAVVAIFGVEPCSGSREESLLAWRRWRYYEMKGFLSRQGEAASYSKFNWTNHWLMATKFSVENLNANIYYHVQRLCIFAFSWGLSILLLLNYSKWAFCLGVVVSTSSFQASNGLDNDIDLQKSHAITCKGPKTTGKHGTTHHLVSERIPDAPCLPIINNFPYSPKPPKPPKNSRSGRRLNGTGYLGSLGPKNMCWL